MPEMKSLTLNGKKYDSFVDQTARKTIEELEKNGTGSTGGTAHGIPTGGKAGQILCKKSDADYDVEWADFEIPEQYGLVTYDQDKTITIT